MTGFVSARRAVRFVQAYLTLLRIHQTLRVGGFKAAQRAFLQPWRGGNSAVSPDITREIEWAVETACGWQWQRSVCLHRSLAAYCLLQKQGANPVFITGVTSRPFASHAWVELDGCPVADSEMEAVRYHYKPILTVPKQTCAASPSATLLQNRTLTF